MFVHIDHTHQWFQLLLVGRCLIAANAANTYTHTSHSNMQRNEYSTISISWDGVLLFEHVTMRKANGEKNASPFSICAENICNRESFLNTYNLHNNVCGGEPFRNRLFLSKCLPFFQSNELLIEMGELKIFFVFRAPNTATITTETTH